MLKKFNEYFSQAQFEPIQSFNLQDDLNRRVWEEGDTLKEEIKKDLIKVAKDYLDNLEIDVELDDIIFTGSLANYNWSEYSDFDVHLIFDFKKVNEDEELVKKYLDTSEKLWKSQHDIKIKGFPVELYCQDANQPHHSTGVYSLLNSIWLKKPSRENFTPDEGLIRKKAEKVMTQIKDLENDINSDLPYEQFKEKFSKVWKKIKDSRQSGLDREGEFSIENLVFKLLRRNGYIERVVNAKRRAYDKQFK